MAPYPLTAPTINAAMTVTSGGTASKQQEMLDEIASNKANLISFLQDRAWLEQLWPGEANFVLLRVNDAAKLVAHCSNNGVKIRDFSTTPMLANCVRLSIGSKDDMTTLKTALVTYGEQA
jgi:histidinol-phosphate aminotransferase